MQDIIKTIDYYSIYLTGFVNYNEDFILKMEKSNITVREISAFYKKIYEQDFEIMIKLLQWVNNAKKDKNSPLSDENKEDLGVIYGDIKYIIKEYIEFIKSNFRTLIEDTDIVREKFYIIKGKLIDCINRLNSIKLAPSFAQK
ncbi:MAG: hypothetical protein AABW41_01355 [Nanoarchaeota archaeon]